MHSVFEYRSTSLILPVGSTITPAYLRSIYKVEASRARFSLASSNPAAASAGTFW
jgi:hypothetical protein